MKSRLSVFSLQVFRFAAVALLMLLIAFLYRFVFLWAYGDFDNLKTIWGDVAFAFLQGARFDILVSLFFLIPLLAFAILAILWRKVFEKVGKIYACVAVLLFTGLLIGDFYYYSFFGNHYSILFFGIVDDDTSAVLKSMWTDFPVIRVIIFFILVSVIVIYLINRIYRSQKLIRLSTHKNWKYSFIVILLLAAFFIRGRLGMFPLRQEDAFFSKNQFVNTLTLNGIFTLKDAHKDYRKNKISISIAEFLEESGFASEKELVAAYLGIAADSIHGDPLLYLQSVTLHNEYIEENQPHIIVLQMEGMGINFMDLQSDSFKILGSLAYELPHCLVYKKFLPAYEGTNVSLEALLTGTSIAPVSLTIHYDKMNLASVNIPLKKAGYTTTFVTGAKKAWRNLNIYLPAQGFDNYESKENIQLDIPEAVEAEWGVYDGYMFQQIWNRLAKAQSPQFIYGMSITNHTPFSLPPHYTVTDLTLTPDIKKQLSVNEKLAFDNFSTYRYACDCLGDFIRKVRESPMAENTIIAVTGDHSIKGTVKAADNDLLKKHGVPLILYIPQRYLEGKIINTDCWGSHKDIFPTLFNLALSNGIYYNLGTDLLSGDATDNFAIDLPVAVMNDDGVLSTTNNKQAFKWQEGTTVLMPVDKDEKLEMLQRKVKLWMDVSKYVTIRSFTNDDNGK